MTRTVLISILVVIGLVALYSLIFGWQLPPTFQSPSPQQLEQVEGPTPTPAGRTRELTEEERQRLERVRTQLFQEGFTASATVETVFPGQGFILQDREGTRVFVRWEGAAPLEGEDVSVQGTVKRFEINTLEELGGRENLLPELVSFLESQRIFIEATSVTPQEVTAP